MSKFVRRNIKKLRPYRPGEQPAVGADVIKLNTNENAYPPSPAVTAAMRKFPVTVLRKYPDPTAETFRKAAARVLKVDPEMILAGNGSDEILNMIIRTFVQPGQTIAYPVPTYSLYPVLAAQHEAEIVEVPFGEDFDLPADLARTDAALVFIANPNAPTGTCIAPAAIERFARETSALVVIDEAYIDFADDNCMPLALRSDNVIVMRSLSKGYSLAGLRFGFAVARADLIGDMLKVKDSYNCDALAIALATGAIEDQRYHMKTVERIRRHRTWLTGRLETLGFRVLPSGANFVWATRRRPAARRIYLQLKRKGILVRYFDQRGLRTGVRITVGRAEENRRLIDALGDIVS